MINNLIEKLKILQILDKYKLEYGIMDEDSQKEVVITILNTDDTKVQVKETLENAMYLTERGTMTIPARPILERCLPWIRENLDKTVKLIVINVLNNQMNENEIDIKMQELALQIETHLKAQFDTVVANGSVLSSILNIDDENEYLIDFKQLKQNIKCKITKY